MPDPNTNGRLKLDPAVAFQIVAWIVAALLTYGAISARIAMVEVRQTDIGQRLDRIEQKIDAALTHLR